MTFGDIPLETAVGSVLAHSTRVRDGVLKKGRVLAASDIDRLRAAGFETVIAARLGADDVTEDAAAKRIAALVAGPETQIAAPFTGRANIFAACDGLAHIDSQALMQLNAIDERVTLATVGSHTRVAKGQMLATVKIIPFAVPEAVLARAERETGRGLVAVAPFKALRAGLILTAFEDTKPQVLARRRDAVALRLVPLGSTIGKTLTVAHTTTAVRDGINQLIAEGLSPILIFATSAIVDRADVIPAGLVAAGGTIERLGMPVDPGNLLLLGRHGATPVIGLPSCAASLKLNGFDWVLERTLAGMSVTSTDIALMGIGGLLKEIDSRPQPRLGGGLDKPEAVRQAPRIAALILAAGRSTRMGTNKLLAEVGGKPIVRRVVETVLASAAHPVYVVVGHQVDQVRAALDGLQVTFVENPRFAEGLSTSLKCGLEALPAETDGALILLGDMPEIAPNLLDRLIAGFAPKEGRSIVLPVAGGKRGNPVLWDRQYFAEMSLVAGDTGAKHLLGLHADQVAEITADDAVHTDIDTPDALAALRRRLEHH
jgi:molybdenum cofactor cytidylyltransferase